MILRIGSSLVEEVDRLTRQLHKLPLEPHISHLGDIFIAVTPIILEKQRDRGRGVPMRAVEWELENVLAGHWARDLECLGRVKF